MTARKSFVEHELGFTYKREDRLAKQRLTELSQSGFVATNGLHYRGQIINWGRADAIDATYCYFDPDIHSLGLKARRELEEGEFLFLYAGEVIDYDRKSNLSPEQSSYVMSLDNRVQEDRDRLFVDATHTGNMSRFLNHSCHPAHQNVIFIKGTRMGRCVVKVETTKDIAKGDTLLVAYSSPEDLMAERYKGIIKCRCSGVIHHLVGVTACNDVRVVKRDAKGRISNKTQRGPNGQFIPNKK